MERNLAVLIDFENIATGCEKEGLGRFDVRVVMRRLKDKGRILVARSYADWGRWNRFKLDLVHEGVQMVELTSHGMQSKNRADIALAVDAMELAYTRAYVDTFVILSGDSDFTPLVMRLKELNKRVIGCGTRRSTSRLIAETCDEFFFYDTLRDEARVVPPPKAMVVDGEDHEEPLTFDEALELMVETLENHQRDEPGAVHGSVLKASMKRKEPTFSEVELGVRTFAQFLEAAREKGLVRLIRDEKAGGYRVDTPQTVHEEPPAPPPRREPARSLSPEAQRLQGLLAEAGLEVGDPRERGIVVEQFVAVCGERARRNRTCAIQFVLGDLLRRCKQEAPDIAPRTVKAVAHAIRRAGLLLHPSGDAALSTTAPFVAPESATQLLDDLHAAGLRALQARGENPDDAVLTELFVGSERAAPVEREPAAEEPRAPGPPAPTGDEGGREGGRDGRRRNRRGGRDRRSTPPVSVAEAAAEAGWPAAIDSDGGGEPMVEPPPAEATAPPAPTVEAPSETTEPTAAAATPAEGRVRGEPRAPRGRRGRGPARAQSESTAGAEEPAPTPPAPPETVPAEPAAEATAAATEGPGGDAKDAGESPERRRRRRGGRRGRRPASED